MMQEILYLKVDRHIECKQDTVTLNDIGKMECANQDIVNRLKTEKLTTRHGKKKKKEAWSVLKVVETIHKVYPNLTISNLGETDFILDWGTVPDAKTVASYIKTFFVCLCTFFGAAFTIMTFNNDVSTPDVFASLYKTFTGQTSDGFTILEVTYSIGLAVGILVFFNHFAGKRIMNDPTPIEVEMRMYEDDVNTTLVENSSRKEKEQDVN